MKSFLVAVYSFFVAALLITCKPGRNEPNPLEDGKPRITAISFPGIPDENVSIDQQNFIITVTLPPVISSKITPSISLTDNARLLPKTWYTLFIGQCPECQTIALADVTDNTNSPAVRYTVKLKASDKLSIGTSAAPIEYELANPVENHLFLPMVNVYANPLPKKVTFIHRSTQEVVSLDSTMAKALPVFLKGWDSTINQIGLDMNYIAKWLPGLYDVDMTLTTGRTVRIVQPLLIKKGPIKVESWEAIEGPRVRPGGFIDVNGSNLFEGDISVSLIDSMDRILSLPEVKFDKYGHQLKVSIPASVRYGHYIMRLKRSGSNPMQSCHRLHIRSQEATPFEILMLGDYFLDPCTLKGPVILDKNRLIGIHINGLDKPARFKLVSSQDVAKIYYAKAILYSYTNFQGVPVTTIPAEVPSGQYKATLQILDDKDNVVNESLPFWRDVVIQ